MRRRVAVVVERCVGGGSIQAERKGRFPGTRNVYTYCVFSLD